MNIGLKFNLRTLWVYVLAILFAGSLHAQDITGNWQGTITTPQRTPRRMVLRVIHDDSGAYKAKIYSIDQDFVGDWVDSITVHHSSVKFGVGMLQLSWRQPHPYVGGKSALRVPVQAATCIGGRQRKSPTGEAANGTPL